MDRSNVGLGGTFAFVCLISKLH